MDVHAWLSEYGYLAVALIVFFEMVGIPFPAETTLILAGMGWAGGTLHPVALIITAIVAHGIGSVAGYGLGRSVGRAVLVRYGKYVGLSEEKLESAEEKFVRFGKRIIFFGKFIAVVRILIPMIAGVNRIPFTQFLIVNGLSTIIWVLTFTFAGYYLGEVILKFEDQLLSSLKTFGWPLLGIIVLGLGTWIFLRIQRNKKKANA